MRPLLRNLTFQVLVAVAIGIALGIVRPEFAKSLKPLGDTFINLVKMVVAPIVFLTIVTGIASTHDLKRLGRVGAKSFAYFTATSLVALVIGMIAVNTLRPGAGFIRPDDLAAAAPVAAPAPTGMLEFLTHIVPPSVVGAFANGELLQIVFFAILFGTAMAMVGERGQIVYDVLERLTEIFFQLVSIIMKVAPIGAFGAMAYTVGTFGLRTLLPLAKLMFAVYVTMAVFIFVVLNLIMRRYGFSLWRFLRYIRQELLLVLGTSSSESAFPRLLEKLERYGAQRSIVGLVVPAGYSFNLDGTSIYMVMAAIFLAQVYNVDMTIAQQLVLLGILMVTSKGAAGVTGSGFVVLAGTLAATKTVPLEGLAILLGVDRFMSEARAITNFIGNGVAALVVARSEGQFDDAMMQAVERGEG
ncbi:MAG: C4-dicarboxylate transporter DctA [Gemmatimonadaceae bacterium]|jgi:aerobic C4-dicarboxylate transport protein|nr:C4-dicarboxylate transporter DctA [Gemmatimonadaceae bacterium]